MDNQRKLLIGYDLREDYSQISCYSYKTYEPISVSFSPEEDDTMVPTVLGIIEETKNWYYGKEAQKIQPWEGMKFHGLLKRVKDKKEEIIFGQTYTAVELLEKYLRKSLLRVKNYFPTETITKLVITIDDTDTTLIEGIYSALENMGIGKDRALVINRGGAFMYYTLCQDKALWMNDVGLFDFSEQGLYYYQLKVNRRPTPMVAVLEKKDFTERLNLSLLRSKETDCSYILSDIAEQVLYKQIVSTLYFTGTGFEGDWAERVIRGLCTGRRVFLGQNLYCFGACYGAKELSGEQKLDHMLLLHNDMLTEDISLVVYQDGSMREILLSESGIPWYDVKNTIEVIVDSADTMEFVFRSTITKNVRKEMIAIRELPKRPPKMTRLEINIRCPEQSKLLITLKDLGFGEIYESSGESWDYSIDI